MRNIDIENFKSSLERLINQSKMPISIVYYILKLEQKQLQKIYYATLNMQAMAEEEEKNKKTQQTEKQQEN